MPEFLIGRLGQFSAVHLLTEQSLGIAWFASLSRYHGTRLRWDGLLSPKKSRCMAATEFVIGWCILNYERFFVFLLRLVHVSEMNVDDAERANKQYYVNLRLSTVLPLIDP